MDGLRPGSGSQRRKLVHKTPLTVGIVLAHNFTLSAFALFIDHLRLAADEGDRSRPVDVQWSIMAAHGAPVRASCGVNITPTHDFSDPSHFDYMVIVGGILHGGDQIDADTKAYLMKASASTTLVGLCTGSFILCRLGLMKERQCCVSWYHYQDFVEEFPDQHLIADRLFIADDDRITCAGGAGTADLATYLISKHLGSSAAQKASQVLLFDRVRGGNETQPHPPLSGTVNNEHVRRALLLMEQNLSQPVPIGDLAAQIGLSTRQFERVCHSTTGKTPGLLYRMVRMRYADWLLSNTDRSVTDIAMDSGFVDCAHFSRQFKEEHGIAPSRHRKRVASETQSVSELAGSRVFG